MIRSAFASYLVEYRLLTSQCNDISCLSGNEGIIINELLQYLLRALGSIEIQMCLRMNFIKTLQESISTEDFYTCTLMKTLHNYEGIHELLIEWEKELENKIDQFVQRGSGWQLKKIDRIDIHFGKYVPNVGGCHLDLPEWIRKKRAVLNIKTRVDCFKGVDPKTAKICPWFKYSETFSPTFINHDKINEQVFISLR